MSEAQVIKAVLLPPTFPPFLVPESERQFMQDMLGRSLADATAQACACGLQPLTGALPHVGNTVHSFTVTANGLVIPFAVLLGDAERVLH